MKPRCIIIGSGLGGLSCGIVLARNGYEVTILEQGSQIGGCLQCFTRRGVTFETGMHFIGSADEGQVLQRLLRYLEVYDSLPLQRLDTGGYNEIAIAGGRFRIANGRDAFIETLAASFPHERDRLAAYFDRVKQIAAASSLQALRYAESNLALNTEYQLRSINEVIEQLIADPLLQSVLVGDLPLYAAERDRTPFATHAFVMNFYNQSAFRIVGGSGRLAQALAATLARYGGCIRTGSRVTKIRCNDRMAEGVETADGAFYPADLVISDAHPRRTLELLDTKLIRPAFRSRIETLRNTASGFSVYLHFRPGTVPYMNRNFYKYHGDTPWGCEHYTADDWPRGYLYMHHCHAPQPAFAESGVILSYLSMEELRAWEHTTVGRRGDDYLAFKQRKTERLIAAVERDFPELRGNILHTYAATPLTYRDYTGTPDGSMYGVARDIASGASNRVPHRTRVPNLLLTGQNINSHGILGVLVGTIVTCSELLTAERIYQQIVEANR